jgi:dihydrofolate reductase
MVLTIIAALNANRVIGKNGTIPWHIPEDQQRFKQVTTGHTVLMGRKTFESIGKPLPERRNIVVSRSGGPSVGVEWYPSLENALKDIASEHEVFVIGGGDIFRQTLERADKLELTIVDDTADGDTFFPPYEHLLGSRFSLSSSNQRNGFRYESYIRSAGTPAAR